MIGRTAILFAVIIAAASSLTIDEINGAQNYWKAGRNEMTDKGLEYFKNLCDSRIPKPEDRLPIKEDIEISEDSIPATFDARQNWSKCPSIQAIKNQGVFGECWAVVTASVFSDRICVSTNSRVKLNISSENLLSCCSECSETSACNGGFPDKAWAYIKSTGVVTGGDYNSQEGCQPDEILPTPSCEKYCTNKKYRIPYNKDLHFVKKAYSLPRKNVQAIQADILKNGPVEAVLDVYSDFFTYSSGVYKHESDVLLGNQAVRVLGWGTENGHSYWLAANSWGRNWGEDGSFKILRGTNECNFESYVTAGLPRD